MFGSLGVPELLIILAIVLLIFGYSRLPQLGKGLGQSIRNFRQGLRGGNDGESADNDRPASR
ncbi:MAG TPA: twin-arginine translocase TatA/TatE family subunit [Thermoanaerobaculia bacterium]|nr:twin-arginine translocase TatA/TatE family subunit [Thermoanaerobaculia bacterium]HXT51877.1 twin-arginine translocase TatA/TatE family subunit [Thermoanaerobaculia bacterium]